MSSADDDGQDEDDDDDSVRSEHLLIVHRDALLRFARLRRKSGGNEKRAANEAIG